MHKTTILASMFGSLIILMTSVAYGVTQNSLTITTTGTEGNAEDIYVGIAPNTNGCLYDGVYFSNADQQSKALAVALAAQAAGRKVRIDYNIDASGRCTGYNIYMQ